MVTNPDVSSPSVVDMGGARTPKYTETSAATYCQAFTFIVGGTDSSTKCYTADQNATVTPSAGATGDDC